MNRKFFKRVITLFVTLSAMFLFSAQCSLIKCGNADMVAAVKQTKELFEKAGGTITITLTPKAVQANGLFQSGDQIDLTFKQAAKEDEYVFTVAPGKNLTSTSAKTILFGASGAAFNMDTHVGINDRSSDPVTTDVIKIKETKFHNMGTGIYIRFGLQKGTTPNDFSYIILIFTKDGTIEYAYSQYDPTTTPTDSFFKPNTNVFQNSTALKDYAKTLVLSGTGTGAKIILTKQDNTYFERI